MSIHSLASHPAQTAPVGLLALNAGRKSISRETAIAAPAHHVKGTSTGSMEAGSTGSTIRIGLPHVDVVLSISAEPGGGTVDGPAFAMAAAAEDMPADPVIERLMHELGQTKSHDNDDGVYGDAIRLALVARWLGLRSQPNSAAQQDPGSGALQKWRLKRVTAYIDEHIDQAISLADLAGIAGLSRMYFAAQFRTATGLRPHEFILRRRIERAKDMLTRTEEALVEIAFNVGFQTQAHFTTVFKRFAGTTPGRWRLSNRQFA